MIFLYIAASVCMALCAGCAVIGIYALRRFRKWRGSVLARFADLDAMIAAMPSVLEDVHGDAEERAAEGKKNGADITDAVMSLFLLRHKLTEVHLMLLHTIDGADGIQRLELLSLQELAIFAPHQVLIIALCSQRSHLLRRGTTARNEK